MSNSDQADEHETPGGSERRLRWWMNPFGPLDPWVEETATGSPVDSRSPPESRPDRRGFEPDSRDLERRAVEPGSEEQLGPVIRQQKRLVFWSRACLVGAVILFLIGLFSLAMWLADSPAQTPGGSQASTPPTAASEVALVSLLPTDQSPSAQNVQSPEPRVPGRLVVALVCIAVAGLLLLIRSLLKAAWRELAEDREDVVADQRIRSLDGIDRAWEQFSAHQLQLRRYYRLGLHQSRIMLTIGLACIVFGVAVIIVVIAYIGSADNLGRAETIVTAAVGGAGGLFTEYVAAIYLKMYAATSVTLNDFHNRLVSTHHLHLANYVAERIQNTADRERTFHAVASEVAKL